MTDPWRSWGNLIDSKVDTCSRWHSSHEHLLQTPDRIGDFLVTQLRNASRKFKDDEVIAEWGRDIHERLADYETESRLLVRLASTGKVVQVLELGIKTTLGVLGIDADVESNWEMELQKEREQRVDKFKSLLRDEDSLKRDIGDTKQQLELLTMMKYGVEKFGDVLLPMELDLIAQVFDKVVLTSNVVVVTIPDWFATDKRGWSHSEKFSIGEEETCLRHVSTWAPLHHPHVRKFYGACHVGNPYVIHELTVSRYPNINPWFYMYGCALGLKYVHERGLVHEKLSLDNLQSLYEFKGVLSGLNLTRIKDQESVKSDILAFGLVMFEFLVDSFSFDDSELEEFKRTQRLPECPPSFFNEEQWNLLTGMCADDPEERMSMIEVTHKLESIHSQTDRDIWSDEEDFGSSQSIEHVDSFVLPDEDRTISDVLQDADILCDEVENFIDTNRPVYNRLLDVYEQLAAVKDPLPLTLVEDYGSILWRFYLRLDKQAEGDYSSVATLCAANTMANRNYGLHHDIDRLILSTKYLQNNALIHHWQPDWQQTLQCQQETLQKCMENPEEYMVQAKINKTEAITLLQYETMNHTNVPRWFIPAYQIELGQHLAEGSFGAVYLGKWFNTDVVVKQVLTNQADQENRRQFYHEVNLWASLNHDNLIKLYGAWHEGQPFFVCERADEGTLIKYSEEHREFPTWRAIWEAAKGLEYLHERGIIHGDLKGNNILVCDGTAKLADFGLSVFAKAENSGGAIGAYRWKAPECLAGSGPTLASDIYSFAMCIIEVISGDFPWGKSLDDAAVKSNVLQKKTPRRPNNFTDEQWDLVTRMCSFEPQSRPNATALVHLLWKFA
ncbi:Cell division control protein 7 [Phytophthora nicotianae]|uniref:Cell division control protein 7 n=1 Tax=Phytophthora nicotianae TaxID=4792 RepID=A0A0W8CJ81_PHYNI|nr:Cell division control protein 7 [Phytophthora nicotianae]